MRNLILELKLVIDLEADDVDPEQLKNMTTQNLVDAVMKDARACLDVDDDAVKLELIAGYEQQ